MSTIPPFPVAEPGKIAYSIRQFCTACALGRTFVYEEIKAGRLRARKAGRRTLIDAAEVQRWLSALQRITVRGRSSEGDSNPVLGAVGPGAAP